MICLLGISSKILHCGLTQIQCSLNLGTLIFAPRTHVVTIRVDSDERIVPNLGIEIEALRIFQLSVWYWSDFGAPFGRHETPH